MANEPLPGLSRALPAADSARVAAHTKLFHEGEVAHRSKTLCPYDPNSFEASLWHVGWMVEAERIPPSLPCMMGLPDCGPAEHFDEDLNGLCQRCYEGEIAAGDNPTLPPAGTFDLAKPLYRTRLPVRFEESGDEEFPIVMFDAVGARSAFVADRKIAEALLNALAQHEGAPETACTAAPPASPDAIAVVERMRDEWSESCIKWGQRKEDFEDGICEMARRDEAIRVRAADEILDALRTLPAQSIREQTIEECAKVVDRLADDAFTYHMAGGLELGAHSQGRKAARAIRALAATKPEAKS